MTALLFPIVACAQERDSDRGLGPALNPLDFGASGDGRSDDTRALQSAIDRAIERGVGVVLPAGAYRTTGLSVKIAAGNLRSRFRLSGNGRRATTLIKAGSSPAPVLSIAATVSPIEANVEVSDLLIDGGNVADGLALRGIAHSTVARVIVENCRTALSGTGSLLLQIEDCTLQRSLIGARFRKDGNVFANAITLRDCRINLNRVFGVDFGEGSMLRLRDCELEANGAAGDVDTGGIVLRASIDDEIGYGLVAIDGCWLERNHGTAIRVESCKGLFLSIANSSILASERGRALTVATALHVNLDEVLAPSPGDTFEVNANRFTMRGGIVYAVRGRRLNDLFENATVGEGPMRSTPP